MGIGSDEILPLLVNHSYGKGDVNVLTKVEATSGVSFREMRISLELTGGLEAAYIDGDNSAVLPSDSLKNHVLALTESARGAALEDFGRTLLERICQSMTSRTKAKAILSERRWHANPSENGRYDTSQTMIPRSNCEVVVTRLGSDAYVVGGEMSLDVIRGGRSSFYGFLKDRYTQQNDVFERVLFGTLSCRWTYGELPLDMDGSRDRIRGLLEVAFSTVSSRSVQETIHGVAVLLLKDVQVLKEVEIEFRSVPLKEYEGLEASGVTTGVWLMSGADHSFTTAKLRRNDSRSAEQ